MYQWCACSMGFVVYRRFRRPNDVANNRAARAFELPVVPRRVLPAATDKPLYELHSSEQTGLYDAGAVPGLHGSNPSIEVGRTLAEQLLSAANVEGSFLLRKKTESKHVVSCLTKSGHVVHHILEQRRSVHGVAWYNEGRELHAASLHAAAVEMLAGRGVHTPRLILALKDAPKRSAVVNTPHYDTVEETDASGSYEPVGEQIGELTDESHYYSLVEQHAEVVTAIVGEQPYRILFPCDHQMYTAAAGTDAGARFGFIPSGNGYETVSAASLRAAEADVRAAKLAAPDGGVSRQGSFYAVFGQEPDGYPDDEVSI